VVPGWEASATWSGSTGDMVETVRARVGSERDVVGNGLRHGCKANATWSGTGYDVGAKGTRRGRERATTRAETGWSGAGSERDVGGNGLRRGRKRAATWVQSERDVGANASLRAGGHRAAIGFADTNKPVLSAR
jgi:hypothetical protein